MTRLDRYLARSVVLATLAIALTLTGAIWLTQSLKFVDLTLNRGLPVGTFLEISVLILPNFLTVILPLALFGAILFTVSRLQGDSELPVMQAVGLSPLRIARPMLLLGVVVVGIGYGLTLWVLPTSYRAFKDMQTELRNSYAALLIQEGVFTQIDKGVTLFVREQSSGGALFGVLVQDERQPARPSTYLAAEGRLTATAGGPRLSLIKGSRQELDRKDGRISTLYFDSYSVDIGRVTGGSALSRDRESTELYVTELLTPKGVSDPRRLASFRTEAHQRLAGPLYTPMYVLVALACLLGGSFSRRGMARKVLTAVVIAIGVQAMGFGLSNLAGKADWAVVALYVLPLLVSAGAAMVVLTGRLPLPRRSQPAGQEQAA
jgi:lipopolysaccharide export system permease protein